MDRIDGIGNLVERRDYAGSFVFEGSSLSEVLTGEGRLIPNRSVKPDFFVRDHLGSVRAVVSGDGRVLETNSYYPYGMKIDALSKTYYTSSDVKNRYKYNGKELFEDLQWLNYGARFYDAAVGRWWVRDPKEEKGYGWSPYRYGFDNPVSVIDPDGRLEDWVERADGTIYWDENATSPETTKPGERYLGKAVVIFNGSVNETLGKEQNMYSKDAILAEVVVYGPNGKDDIKTYKGYTMTSDPSKFGVVKEGEYTVNRLKPTERKGPYGSEWVVESRNAHIPAMNDYNPAHPERKPGYLTGVFIHRPNNNGWAGTFTKNGRIHGVSEGCLLIEPKKWNEFNNQLKNINSFHLILKREGE